MDTIVTHRTANAATVRMCMRCLLHTDENGDPDQDYYTARQYFKFMAVPKAERCDHRRMPLLQEHFDASSKKDMVAQLLKAGMRILHEMAEC